MSTKTPKGRTEVTKTETKKAKNLVQTFGRKVKLYINKRKLQLLLHNVLAEKD
jgi:hypothetical protein